MSKVQYPNRFAGNEDVLRYDVSPRDERVLPLGQLQQILAAVEDDRWVALVRDHGMERGKDHAGLIRLHDPKRAELVGTHRSLAGFVCVEDVRLAADAYKAFSTRKPVTLPVYAAADFYLGALYRLPVPYVVHTIQWPPMDLDVILSSEALIRSVRAGLQASGHRIDSNAEKYDLSKRTRPALHQIPYILQDLALFGDKADHPMEATSIQDLAGRWVETSQELVNLFAPLYATRRPTKRSGQDGGLLLALRDLCDAQVPGWWQNNAPGYPSSKLRAISFKEGIRRQIDPEMLRRTGTAPEASNSSLPYPMCGYVQPMWDTHTTRCERYARLTIRYVLEGESTRVFERQLVAGHVAGVVLEIVDGGSSACAMSFAHDSGRPGQHRDGDVIHSIDLTEVYADLCSLEWCVQHGGLPEKYLAHKVSRDLWSSRSALLQFKEIVDTLIGGGHSAPWDLSVDPSKWYDLAVRNVGLTCPVTYAVYPPRVDADINPRCALVTAREVVLLPYVEGDTNNAGRRTKECRDLLLNYLSPRMSDALGKLALSSLLSAPGPDSVHPDAAHLQRIIEQIRGGYVPDLFDDVDENPYHQNGTRMTSDVLHPWSVDGGDPDGIASRTNTDLVQIEEVYRAVVSLNPDINVRFFTTEPRKSDSSPDSPPDRRAVSPPESV